MVFISLSWAGGRSLPDSSALSKRAQSRAVETMPPAAHCVLELIQVVSTYPADRAGPANAVPAGAYGGSSGAIRSASGS